MELIVDGKTSFQFSGLPAAGIGEAGRTVGVPERLPDGSWLVAQGQGRYRVEVLELDRASRKMKLRMGGRTWNLEIREPLDALLDRLGMKETQHSAVQEILAPMPGLVLRLDVKSGQQVQKGDSLLVLEAMKMENVFKAPQDGIVRDIRVRARQAVEKGQVLLVLE